jgi:hypothetical protein
MIPISTPMHPWDPSEGGYEGDSQCRELWMDEPKTHMTGSFFRIFLTAAETNLCHWVSFPTLARSRGFGEEGAHLPGIHDDLINEFIHPAIAHDEPTL